MEEVKKAQDREGSLVVKAARLAKMNNIDAATLSLFGEVFKIIDGVSVHFISLQRTNQDSSQQVQHGTL